MTKVHKNEIAKCCRILGVHVTATLDELKSARDRLAKLYHPDKNQNLSTDAFSKITERFQQIQTSYDFLKTNYDDIQIEYEHLRNNTLSARGPHRSHWIYTEISHY